MSFFYRKSRLPMGLFSGLFYTWLLSVVLLAFSSGCVEKVDNSLGFIVLPPEVVGPLPQQLESVQTLEIAAVQGVPAAKGDQYMVFVGRDGIYEMRTLLNYLITLPDDATLTRATLTLYVLSVGGDLPLGLRVHLLDRKFEEAEVTWENADAGSRWSAPGGDYSAEALGEAGFDGERLDTVAVELDIEVLKAYLGAQAHGELPLIVLPGEGDALLGLVAREIMETSAVASRLDLTYSVAGETTSKLLERRAYMDATIACCTGVVGSGGLVLGELPSSQLFFAYDLSSLPPLAIVNQARLHLSISGSSVIDSFQVATYVSEETSFIETSDRMALGNLQSVFGEDTELVLDVTMPVQRMILGDDESTRYRYLVLASLGKANVAGYVGFYPLAEPNSLKRPYLKLIYTDAPDAAKLEK